MTAQLLHRAGLFLGQDMLPKHRSNPHGHFEDREIVRFHDRVLGDNGLDWQVDGSKLPVAGEEHRRQLREIVAEREAAQGDAAQEMWGFKDPRVCLFMDTWKSLLPDARILIVYRDFVESTYSLQHRAANGLLYGTGNPAYHRRLWHEPDLALKMWTTHNRLLVDFADAYPEDTLAVSFDMLRNGFPLIEVVNQYWGLSLREIPTSQVFDAGATAESPGVQFVSEERLIEETLEVWEELDRLGERTGELTGVPVGPGGQQDEKSFHIPDDAYALAMERDFQSFELQYLRTQLEESEKEQRRLRGRLKKLRQNSVSAQRRKKLEGAEKDLALIVKRMSQSKLAPLFRLKSAFRELERKYRGQ